MFPSKRTTSSEISAEGAGLGTAQPRTGPTSHDSHHDSIILNNESLGEWGQSALLTPYLEATFRNPGSPQQVKPTVLTDARFVWPDRGVFNPYHPFVVLWDYAMLLPMAYVATVMPFVVLFELEVATHWVVLEYLVTAAFGLDMALTFNLAFIDAEGHLIMSRSAIAKRYLSTWFVVDALSLLPLDLILGGILHQGAARLVRLLRVLRLFRLLRLLKIYKMPPVRRLMTWVEDAKVVSPATLRVLNTIAVTMLVMHLLAGVWHYIGVHARSPTWLESAQLTSAPLQERYFASLYFVCTTLSTVGYGDITANNIPEYIFSIIAQLFSQLGSAILLAEILEVVANHSSNSAAQRDRADSVRALIACRQFPVALQQQLLNWARETNGGVQSLSHLLAELPTGLRRQVMMWSFGPSLRSIKLLEHQPVELFADIAWKLVKRTVAKGDVIFREGEPASTLYFLRRGMVELTAGTGADAVVVDTFHDGDHFGDTDLTAFAERAFTATALQRSEVWGIRRSDLTAVTAAASTPSEHDKLSVGGRFLAELNMIASQRRHQYETVLKRHDGIRVESFASTAHGIDMGGTESVLAGSALSESHVVGLSYPEGKGASTTSVSSDAILQGKLAHRRRSNSHGWQPSLSVTGAGMSAIQSPLAQTQAGEELAGLTDSALLRIMMRELVELRQEVKALRAATQK